MIGTLKLPDIDLESRVEQLAWDCRTDETPKDLDYEKDMVTVFGYTCQEYWNPDPINRTIDLRVCPYWVDKEWMLSRMDEVWEWSDEQVSVIKSNVGIAMQFLSDEGAPTEQIFIPKTWYAFMERPLTLLGARCSPTDVFEILVMSPDKYGRFHRLDLYQYCDHDMHSRLQGRIVRCSKCGFRDKSKEVGQ